MWTSTAPRARKAAEWTWEPTSTNPHLLEPANKNNASKSSQCCGDGSPKLIVRPDVVSIGGLDRKWMAHAAIAPTSPPKIAAATFWYVYEKCHPGDMHRVERPRSQG